ncbi:hypothetical protein ACK8QS_22295 (plasmid) [Ectopseudomonas mendocina]
MSAKPTQQVYDELQKAYEFFNQELFDGRLPPCVITLQRQHDTYGYFSANQFQSRAGGVQAHEIALNPSYFAVRTIHETLSVLVREMVSLDQLLNTKRDKLPRRRYRNTEWADMCEGIGLMPTSTGRPGGRRVGDNVQTYVIDGGPFDSACSRLVDEDFTLSWVDRFPPKTLPESSGAGGDELLVDAGLSAFTVDDAGDALGAESGALVNATVEAGAEGEGGALEAVFAAVESGELSSDTSALDTQPVPVPGKPAPPPMKRYEPVRVEELQQQGIEPREAAKGASKTTFQCPICEAKTWGKPTLRVACLGSDDTPHEAERMVVVTSKRAKAKAEAS